MKTQCQQCPRLCSASEPSGLSWPTTCHYWNNSSQTQRACLLSFSGEVWRCRRMLWDMLSRWVAWHCSMAHLLPWNAWNAWNAWWSIHSLPLPSPTQTNTQEVSAYLHPMQECVFWGQFMANPKIKCNLTVLLMLSLQSSDRNTIAFTVWRCLYWNKPNFDILYLVGCVCEC